MRFHIVLTACFCLLLAGCATYMPPGSNADLNIFAPPNIQQELARKPSNPFPASIAAIRVQGPAYENFHLQRYGGAYGDGKYTIIMVKELEEEAQFARIDDLPQVEAVVTINRMLVQDKLDNEEAVRTAAARLQADLVFLYTFDTSFFDVNLAKPLSAVTLGLSPTRKISVTTTASALLIDTRTGYIYAAFEVTERDNTLATTWGSKDAADKARQKNEQNSFIKLVDEFISTWPKILERHQES